MRSAAEGNADAVAFNALFRELAPRIRRYVVRTVGADHADDVVSETFIIVWRRWHEVPSAEGALASWVFRAAHNVMAHHVRSQMRRAGVLRRISGTIVDSAPDPVHTVDGNDHVARMLSLLPHAEREAMALVVLDDLTPTQAARVLGCTQTALTTRLSRARRRLQAHAATVRAPDSDRVR